MKPEQCQTQDRATAANKQISATQIPPLNGFAKNINHPMTTTKSTQTRQRLSEQRQSRIKAAIAFILNNTSAGLLNNRKWYKIFEWLDNHKTAFELKTLLSDDPKTCDHIRELEPASILIDDSGDFTAFLEIERLTAKQSKEFCAFLNGLNIEYITRQELVDIDGYRR